MSPVAADIGASSGRALRVQGTFADALVAVAADVPDRVVNVLYADLMAAPAREVVQAFAQLGIAVDPEETGRAVAAFLDAQAHGGRAAPPSGYGDFGHSLEEVHADPSTARYIEAFGIPVEGTRISAPG